MLKELHDRINKIKTELDNITKLPEIIAVKKGQIMQNTSNTENEKTIEDYIKTRIYINF